MSIKARSLLKSGVKYAIAFGLLAYVIDANREQLALVLTGQIRMGLFFWAFVFYIAGVLLAFARWLILARAADMELSRRDAFRLGFIGLFFNMVIPGAVGGDVIKAAYFCREQGARTKPISSIVIDRFVGLLGLFLLASGVGLASWAGLSEPVRRLVIAAVIASMIVAGLLCLAFLPLKKARSRQGGSRLSCFLSDLADVGIAYRNAPVQVLSAIAMAVVTHTLSVLAFYSVNRALFAEVPSLSTHYTIVPLVLFSTAIPLPMSAIGASEQISYGLFRLVSADGGAVAMMGFRLLQIVGAMLGAAVYLHNRSAIKNSLSLNQRTRIAGPHIDVEPALLLAGTSMSAAQ